MKADELKTYATKFITATLDDLTEVSGYISNPKEIKDEEGSQLTLVNGLQNSVVLLSRIMSVRVVSREDTTEIPILGESSDLVSRLKQKQISSFEERLDELLDKSISGSLEVTLPNGKVIQSRKNDE